MGNAKDRREVLAVSVIIPAYNESEIIEELLDSIFLHSSTVPAETIIINANSSDTTEQKIKNWKHENKEFNLRLLNETSTTYPGKARNIGVENSSFDKIVFIDCGIIPEQTWLDELTRPLFENPAYDISWGRVESLATKKSERIMAYIIEPKKTVKRRFVPNMCIKRAVFEDGHYFPENLRAGEDVVFKNKLKAQNYQEVFSKSDSYYTGYPEGITELFTKWKVYAEYEVKAGIYKRKLTLILFQLLFVFLITILFNQYFGLILSILASIMLLFLLMLVLKSKDNTYYLKGFNEYCRAFIILVIINIARIIGVFNALLKYKVFKK